MPLVEKLAAWLGRPLWTCIPIRLWPGVEAGNGIAARSAHKPSQTGKLATTLEHDLHHTPKSPC